MEIEPFSYYFISTKTPYLPSVKYKWVFIKKITYKNIPKTLWENVTHNLKMGENIVIILHIYGAIAIFLLFYDDQDTLSTECEI